MRSSQSALRRDDRRKEARYTLVLRAGVLEQDGKTSFCMVKNISSTGVQLKTYNRPVLDEAATLRIADELPVHGRIAWIDGDNVGIHLDGELDSNTVLRVRQKLRPDKRRAIPRVGVEASALLRTGGRVLRATVLDISSLGARVRSEQTQLHLVERVVVDFTGLPSIKAYVRWTNDEEIGLAFETPIPMQIVANWIEGRARIIP